MIRYGIKAAGIVQGVGFRPFVYRLAKERGLSGRVYNSAQGVYIEIQGGEESCASFLRSLKTQPPPAARIEALEVCEIPLAEETDFVIESSHGGKRATLISPDLGVCADCGAETLDPADRRYGYAFTNCTNCGPRFTIIRDVPYDRPQTTMAVFPMCNACQREYEDPTNRRFHAQPNACARCGPAPRFVRNGEEAPGDWREELRRAMERGEIAAIKGIGGFCFACDATNPTAVERLRSIKARDAKPFALMMRDEKAILHYCEMDEEERALLNSVRKPIILLKKKKDCPLPTAIAPGNGRIGVMLPYTPLHLLMMQDAEALVMTSANLSGETMAYEDDDPALDAADCVLTHNREIFRRMDDSVAMVAAGKPRLLRRARGYVPEPVYLGQNGAALALGAQEKNTFCLTRGGDAILSGHMGDLDREGAEEELLREIAAFTRIFEIEPELVACDLHPDYVSTRMAGRFGKPVVQIQHHHAHFASVLAEQRVEGKALGVIMDGSGFGEDGCVWGTELLYGNVATSQRLGHGLYAPMPGGEAAVREPWRMGLAMLAMAKGEASALSFYRRRKEAELVLAAQKAGVNAPLSCGMGRLFDGVASLAGLMDAVSFEGQAAMALEAAMATESALEEASSGSYSFHLLHQDDGLVFDWRDVICSVAEDAGRGEDPGRISLRFHRAVAGLIQRACLFAREQTGCERVALSGGVFQNAFLLGEAQRLLQRAGFQVYANEKIPANDGGISYGQTASALARSKGGLHVGQTASALARSKGGLHVGQTASALARNKGGLHIAMRKE